MPSFEKCAATARNVLLLLSLTLPWLNPFTSTPSTAVVPLLLSWMLSACALLLVVDLPSTSATPSPRGWALAGGVWLAALLASVLSVPEVVDTALTVGLLATLVTVWAMTAVGRRVAVQSNELLPWVVAAWLLAAAVSSLLGVLQYLDLSRDLAPWVNQPMRGDAFGNLRQRNQYASLTSIGLVTLLAWVAGRPATTVSQQSLWGMAWPWMLLNVLAAGVACSLSRTGAVQWVLVGLLAALWAWRPMSAMKPRQTQLFCMALAAPFLVALWSVWMPMLAQQITGSQGASMILRVAGQVQDYGMCASRRVLWSNMFNLVLQRPWLGWGWGEADLAHFMTVYSGARFCDLLDNAHDLPLHVAVEFGLPFAVLSVLLGLAWVFRRQPWRETNAWRVMGWGVLLVVGLHSLLEYPLWYGPFQMAVGLGLGLVWACPSRQVENDDLVDDNNPPMVGAPAASPPTQFQQNMPLVVCSLLFLGCLYAAWDYNRVAQIYRPAASRDAPYRDNPMGHAKQSWLFRNQADFADLTTRTLTAENAADTYALALRVMHYSPEARVVQKAIDSAKLLGLTDDVVKLTDQLDAGRKAAL
ncbi:PglL family O-oligosaccharyltransferase [Limnohabitans sp. B9-3]|uniref:PglL family O-oligosaccharyltransferase n=1 Tax=Limnohabitans sp. B9-3 TaxID=1100707 RepID=UPI0013046A6D|nr:O-antigen ligase family protein [Limnohabitans sp. B9-3]